MLADVELTDAADRRARTYSNGMRQRLGLAQAMLGRPRLLLLDEPVASLDPLARREFLQDLMEATAEQELSVVLSSHLVADLERVCDYLIVLACSRVQVAGAVEDLLAPITCCLALAGARPRRRAPAGGPLMAALEALPRQRRHAAAPAGGGH